VCSLDSDDAWQTAGHEGTHGHIRTSDTPISVGVYVVSSESECSPTKVILTSASHPHCDVTAKNHIDVHRHRNF